MDFYRYLGILFHNTGTWTEHISETKIKGHRTSLLLRDKLKSAHSLPVKDILDLYKTCVQSSLLYGCELWSSMNIETIETILTDFARYILGVRRSTPNIGTLSELGLLPYKRFTVYRVIKYWLRIVMEDLPLQSQAYTVLQKTKGNNWTSYVQKNLNKLGFGYIWLEQKVENVDIFLLTLLRRIRDCHTQEFDQATLSMPRLTVLNYLQTDPARLSHFPT